MYEWIGNALFSVHAPGLFSAVTKRPGSQNSGLPEPLVSGRCGTRNSLKTLHRVCYELQLELHPALFTGLRSPQPVLGAHGSEAPSHRAYPPLPGSGHLSPRGRLLTTL